MSFNDILSKKIKWGLFVSDVTIENAFVVVWDNVDRQFCVKKMEELLTQLNHHFDITSVQTPQADSLTSKAQVGRLYQLLRKSQRNRQHR